MTVVAFSLTTLGPYVGIPAGVHFDLNALYPPEVGCSVLIPQFEIRESVVTRTDTALAYLSRALAEGLALKIVGFVVGASGYDPTSFARPTPVVGGSFVSGVLYEGPVDVELASVDGTTISYTCRIPSTLRAVLGEVALIAEVVDSPLNPSEVGTRFQFAVGHCPAVVKHNLASSIFRVVLVG